MDTFSTNQSDTVTVGRIANIDRRNRSFTVAINNNPSDLIRFNLANNARVFDLCGRQITFSRLFPGLRVRVRHANFMTMSIPPQTTAFDIQVIQQCIF